MQPFYRILDAVEPSLRRIMRPALWLLVVVPFAWGTYALLFDQFGANPVEAVEHYTGEWTLRLLAATLAVTPLVRITGWGWLIPQRRFLGLAAFFYAMVHFLMYVGLDKFFDLTDIVLDVRDHLYVTVGFAALVLMVPLALTSTKASIRRLGGKKWNRLHRLVYVSAILGCIHYLWAVKKDREEPMLYTAVIVALIGSRLVIRRPLRARRVMPTAEGVTKPSVA